MNDSAGLRRCSLWTTFVMATTTFDFEKPIHDLERDLKKLQETLRKKEAKAHKHAAEASEEGDAAVVVVEKPKSVDPELEAKIKETEERLVSTRREVYANLTPWQRIQIARHPSRPHSLDYIRRLFSDWIELSGDRNFGNDAAVVAGLARFQDRPVAVIGHQKGADLKDNIARNFGMMHPEGYRKALRVMKLADKFEMPILIFIDTPGAYPGIGAEERGQGEAIGRNIMEMFNVRVPIICAVIGEGASGGALGIGVGDRLLMMQYAWYCVISPEGCASILWRDAAKAGDAAQALKLTADDLLGFGVIDEIVPEPIGGAHLDPTQAGNVLRERLTRHLEELSQIPPDELVEQRFRKYRRMGEACLTRAESADGAVAIQRED